MLKKYFKNYTNVDVYTSTEDANKIDFYLKNKWLEVDLADFESAIREGEGNLIREDFFLENLAKLSLDERTKALDQIEEDFDLVHSTGYGDSFDNNSDMELLFIIYGVSCTERFDVEPDIDGCFYSEYFAGKVVGEYTLEQLGEKYVVPMKVIRLDDDYVEGLDLRNTRKV